VFRRVALIQRLNRGRLRLRIDGNQGYDRDDAVMFASSLDPAAIELLEQPTAAADWDAAKAVAAASTVPLMLDESIYRLADIDRAAAVGARFVKLKLMKRASLDRLVVGLDRIHALGMTAVLGNGVATDIGCWMETCVAARCVKTAGEMNGFRRLARPMVPRPMTVERGVVSIPRDFIPELDEAALAGVTLADARFSRGREWRTEAATA
jgi:L-alanine-DL-glutamate epimerase-like enolase superfamily enzyme